MKEKVKIIPMTYDKMFKSVLLNEKAKDYLVEVIHQITGIKKEELNNLVFKNEEHLRYGIGQKKKESDIVIEIIDNTICLEMNKEYKPGIFERNFSYGGMLRENNIQRINGYDKLGRTILINFDNFNRYNDDRSVIKFSMLDKERLIEEGIKYDSYHVILPNINKKYYNKDELNKLEKLIEVMNIQEEDKLKEYVKSNKEVRKVAGLIMEISKDEMLSGLYDREEVMEKLNNGAISEGIKQGFEQGREEGKNENKIEVIKKLYKNNVDIKIISDSVNLSIEKIKEIISEK